MKTLSLIFTEKGQSLGLLLLRLAFGAMMMSHGLAKLSDFATLETAFADPIGLGSQLSLMMIIAAEVGASILLILGLATRLAALALAFAMCVAAFVVHAPFSFSGSELPLVYLVVYLTLLIAGAGRYSIDHLIARKLT